jgi:hypothetical protein
MSACEARRLDDRRSRDCGTPPGSRWGPIKTWNSFAEPATLTAAGEIVADFALNVFTDCLNHVAARELDFSAAWDFARKWPSEAARPSH